MRKERSGSRILLLAVMAAAAACAHSDPKQGPVIKDLDIEGNRAVGDGEIKKKIVTAETNWLPFSRKFRFDRSIWATDLRRLERYYQSRGYYDAKVVEDTIEPAGKDAVKIRVRVEEGPPTLVSRMEVKGLENLPKAHRDRVLSQVTVREGEIFAEDSWNATRTALEAELAALGYAEAGVDGTAKVDLATHQAFIDVEVDPGMRYRLGGVKVVQQENARVEGWRIEEQVRKELEDREWYSPQAAREVQQQVFDMQVFGAAQVRPGKGDPATGLIPLEVDVTERPFHEIGAGFGIGFEPRRQEGHLIGEYTHRDFLGGLRVLTLTGRAGWAFIPSVSTFIGSRDAVTFNGPTAKLTVGLEQPRLWNPDFRFRAELEGEIAVEPAYSYTGGRVRLSVPWRPVNWLRIEPAYAFEIYDLRSGETSLTGDTPQLLFGCEGTCALSYLEQTIAYDRRDDPQVPRRGVYLGVAFQEGGGPLGGSFDYLRILPEVRGYVSVPPARRLTFAGRVRVGTLIPLRGDDRDSPIVARFFLGGDDMRGFSVQRLSPMRLVEKSNPDPDDRFNAEPVPLGGNGMFEMSFETRYEVRKGIILAAFVDSGFVTTEHVSFDASYFTRNLLWAVGTGVRYVTPIGSLRLDFAYRLPVGPALPVEPEPGLTFEPSQGCFGIGNGYPNRAGAPEGICTIHLSIGEAF